MLTLKNKEYRPNCGHNDTDIDEHYKRGITFGHFSDDGKSYTVTDRNTPRPWAQYLCNDKIRSAVSNTGKGFVFYNGVITPVTKHREWNGNYLPRNFNGQRSLLIEYKGKEYDFFYDSTDYTFTVHPGYVEFKGKIEELDVKIIMFVPQNEPVEVWNIDVLNNGEKGEIKLTAIQHLNYSLDENLSEIADKNALYGCRFGVTNAFTADKINSLSYNCYSEELDQTRNFTKEKIVYQTTVQKGETALFNVLSVSFKDVADLKPSLKFFDREECTKELGRITAKWGQIVKANCCDIPDKNLQYFLNIWLKNQIYLTFRYDRAGNVVGYRDGLQDSWGNLFVEPAKSGEKIKMCLKYMLPDGRCPRQFDQFGNNHDMEDFADSPTWAPIALNGYIKETGDFSILDTVLPFLNSDETSTVENHIFRALDYLYHSRGKNGLILIRDGDWADGLSGINKYGSDATSVWLTIAAFNAQNLMAEIYEQIGNIKKANLMKERSAEYKQIVNTVGWDGDWFTYAFFEDGEPIGSHTNKEGKIWLNPQTWGVFSGIVDDKKRIDKITRAVSRYLDTPFGSLVNYPPYVFYGERCGRIGRQRPGMFLNSSVYNHAASFKVFSDVKRNAPYEALDTISRCLPNHPDNSDTRRTSEPYTVGNVYYGPEHPRAGMNLFTWFTATPSWLIHGGFEEILGVKPDFCGLRLSPCVIDEWQEYFVQKLFRGTVYNIKFVRDEGEKGIWIDGIKSESDTVLSKNDKCDVLVKF